MTTRWNHRYAQRTEQVKGSAIRKLLKLTQSPEIISFAGGLPAAELFPTAAFEQATQRVLREQGERALQYGVTEGYLPLREFICNSMRAYNISAEPENILITSGSQQALDLIGMILLNPGDTVLTENPTYIGALQAWRAYQANFVTAPVDADGLMMQTVKYALSSGPKFMYILPNFQNPSGVTLSLERRLELIDIADQYGVPIIEDDPYGALRYEGEHLPPLVVLDNERLNKSRHTAGFSFGNVIYTSTFSKTLAPGLRLGWMVAPREVIEKATLAKQGLDLHTSTFSQMVTYEVIKDGFLKTHIRSLRTVYKERRDVMLAALEKNFPAEATWTTPDGGLFLWITLPPRIDTNLVLEKSLKNGVAFVPGNAFDPLDQKNNTMRLNFSNTTPKDIEIGIEKLAGALEDTIGETALFYGGA